MPLEESGTVQVVKKSDFFFYEVIIEFTLI